MPTRKRARMTKQNSLVLDHLHKIGPLTPLSALVNYGVARLAARVDELRSMGHYISTELKTVNHKRYASYTLHGE